MKVVVCGGRTYSDFGTVQTTLDQLGITELIEGGATGADWLAKIWAEKRGIRHTTVKADWQAHGKTAGPMRNAKMIAMKPDLVVAFPGGRGTANMVKQAVAAGVKVNTVKSST